MAELRDVYIENLDNSDVGIQGTLKRLGGMLMAVAEELPDVPLFTQLSAMCSTLHVTCPRSSPSSRL